MERPQSLRPSRESSRLPQNTLNKGTQKAEQLFIEKFPRIQESAFPNFNPDMVKNDQQAVADIEERWAQKHNQESPEGPVLEALFLDMATRGWLGSDVSVVRTAKFDDYFAGVDAILGMRDKLSTAYVGLGVDATSSSAGLSHKMDRVYAHAQAGTLGTVKYAAIDNFTGTMTKLPESVIFVDRASLVSIIASWVETKDDTAPAPFSIDQHPFQIDVLNQMSFQCRRFSEITKNEAAKNALAHAKMVVDQRLHERVETLKIDKQKLLNSLRSPSMIAIRNYFDKKNTSPIS